MKELIIFTILLTILGCSPKKSDQKNQKTEEIKEVKKETTSQKVKVDLKKLKVEMDGDNLKILDKNSGKELTTVKKIFKDHYNGKKVVNNRVYTIKRVGDISKDNWTDQLWVYTSSSLDGKKLSEAKGIDYSVSKKNGFISVLKEKNIEILDHTGKVLKSFTLKDLYGYDLESVCFQGWSNDQYTLWIADCEGGETFNYIKIDNKNFTHKKYKLKEGVGGDEMKLNFDKGLIAFTDYPIMLDADSLKDFKKSKKIVTLSVYNLETKTIKKIATSKAKKFNLKWVDSDTIEFDDPKTGKRVQKNIK